MPTYYKRNVNPTNNNWNQADNWSTVSSTSSVNTGTFPSSATLDPVIFDANSANITVNVPATCASLNFSGYTNTINFSSQINVGGDVTLGTGMSFGIGVARLLITANCTYTSNGVTFPNLLQIGNTTAITVTLGSSATTVGSVYVSASSVGLIQTLNSNNLNILGNFTLDVHLAGTTQVNLTGTGTWNAANTVNSEVRTKLNINTTGTITRGANGYFYSGSELRYTQGTLVNGSTNLGLSFGGNTSAVISNGVNWGNIFIYQNTTTLSDDMNINNFEFSNNNATLNGNNLRINGNINLVSGAQILAGTTTLQIIGSGNQSWTGAGNARISTPVTINKTGGTLTLAGTLNYGGTLLSVTAGSINPGTSTFVIPAGISTTINGLTFWNLTMPASTLNQSVPSTIQNNLTLGGSGNVTFSGSAGWTCANLICTTPGTSITLSTNTSGASYTTTTLTNFSAATNASRITISSSSATQRATWTLQNGATQALTYVDANRIDSSQGQTIWTLGTISTTPLGSETLNWATGSQPSTVAYTFVN